MPEPVEPAGNPEPTNTPNPAPAEPNPAGSGSEQYVPRKDYDALKERVDSLSGYVRRLENKGGTPAPTTEPTGNDGKGKPDDKVAELERRFNEREAKLAKRAKETEIRAAINAHGLGKAEADLLFDHVVVRHGENIKFEDDEVFVEGDIPGSRKPVSSIVDVILKGDLGERFKPAKQVPSGAGLQGRTGGDPKPARNYADIPAEERAKMSDAERAAALRNSPNKPFM